jgi:hypothetical protein
VAVVPATRVSLRSTPGYAASGIDGLTECTGDGTTAIAPEGESKWLTL